MKKISPSLCLATTALSITTVLASACTFTTTTEGNTGFGGTGGNGVGGSSGIVSGGAAGIGGSAGSGGGGSAGVAGAAGQAAAGGAGGSVAVGPGASFNACGGSTGVTCNVRFADLAPLSKTAFDVCLRIAGSTDSWIDTTNVVGPVFGAKAQDFYYPGATVAFANLGPGTYDVRAVRAGALSCDETPPVPVDDQIVIGAAQYTLAFEGDMTRGIHVFQYADPPAPTTNATFTVINALTETTDSIAITTTVNGMTTTSDAVQPLFPEAKTFDVAPAAAQLSVVTTTGAAQQLVAPMAFTPVAGATYSLFVGGTKIDDADKLFRPQIIICRNTTAGASTDTFINSGCAYSTTPLSPRALCRFDGASVMVTAPH